MQKQFFHVPKLGNFENFQKIKVKPTCCKWQQFFAFDAKTTISMSQSQEISKTFEKQQKFHHKKKIVIKTLKEFKSPKIFEAPKTSSNSFHKLVEHKHVLCCTLRRSAKKKAF